MGLSSNSLIHFTPKKEYLVGILENNFKINYCVEEIFTEKYSMSGAFPMVCFCDIPLSEITAHMFNYGDYGIGLKREWIISNGLNPVLYLEKKSDIARKIFVTFKAILKGKPITNYNDDESTIVSIMQYMKNYQGDLKRNNNTIPDYRFSDEREWRYIPSKDQVDYVAVPVDEFKNNKPKYNNKLKKLRLEFSPDDISYIILSDESEISDFIEIIRRAKGSKYTMAQVDRLITRIFTKKQILSDL